VELRFCEPSEHVLEFTAQEIVRRLLDNFPGMLVDRDKGNELVQRKLDKLIEISTPDVILESHKTYFDNTIYVAISQANWLGARVESFIQSGWFQLGDCVSFDVSGALDEEILRLVAQDLSRALNMVLCPD
jgi:hypothetical protein